MAQKFNHTVCMDLNIWQGTSTIILYIIDIFTRFTIAKIIPDKTPDRVLKVLVNDWIKFWGSPSQILVDNGGEFANAKMIAIYETFSIKFLTTGAYSPNQNGLCEKNHQLVDKMMDDDKNLKFPEAKNTLANVYGFPPYSLSQEDNLSFQAPVGTIWQD